MTIQDLIEIAEQEEFAPRELELVMAVGGTYFEVITADEQDVFNPAYVLCTLIPLRETEAPDA